VPRFFDRLARAVMNAQAGGFLANPPGFGGDPGLGIAGITGAPRPREWDAVVTATAPGVPGDAVHFFVLPDGTIIVNEDVPDGVLAPLADALERDLRRPYRAQATRHEHDVWVAGARSIDVVTLPEAVAGDAIELTSVGGEVGVSVDGVPAAQRLPQLEALGRRRGSEYALRAERLDATTWAVEVSVL
jgi:hypothetical protein